MLNASSGTRRNCPKGCLHRLIRSPGPARSTSVVRALHRLHHRERIPSRRTLGTAQSVRVATFISRLNTPRFASPRTPRSRKSRKLQRSMQLLGHHKCAAPPEPNDRKRGAEVQGGCRRVRKSTDQPGHHHFGWIFWPEKAGPPGVDSQTRATLTKSLALMPDGDVGPSLYTPRQTGARLLPALPVRQVARYIDIPLQLSPANVELSVAEPRAPNRKTSRRIRTEYSIASALFHCWFAGRNEEVSSPCYLSSAPGRASGHLRLLPGGSSPLRNPVHLTTKISNTYNAHETSATNRRRTSAAQSAPSTRARRINPNRARPGGRSRNPDHPPPPPARRASHLRPHHRTRIYAWSRAVSDSLRPRSENRANSDSRCRADVGH